MFFNSLVFLLSCKICWLLLFSWICVQLDVLSSRSIVIFSLTHSIWRSLCRSSFLIDHVAPTMEWSTSFWNVCLIKCLIVLCSFIVGCHTFLEDMPDFFPFYSWNATWRYTSSYAFEFWKFFFIFESEISFFNVRFLCFKKFNARSLHMYFVFQSMVPHPSQILSKTKKVCETNFLVFNCLFYYVWSSMNLLYDREFFWIQTDVMVWVFYLPLLVSFEK